MFERLAPSLGYVFFCPCGKYWRLFDRFATGSDLYRILKCGDADMSTMIPEYLVRQIYERRRFTIAGRPANNNRPVFDATLDFELFHDIIVKSKILKASGLVILIIEKQPKNHMRSHAIANLMKPFLSAQFDNIAWQLKPIVTIVATAVARNRKALICDFRHSRMARSAVTIAEHSRHRGAPIGSCPFFVNRCVFTGDPHSQECLVLVLNQLYVACSQIRRSFQKLFKLLLGRDIFLTRLTSR